MTPADMKYKAKLEEIDQCIQEIHRLELKDV